MLGAAVAAGALAATERSKYVLRQMSAASRRGDLLALRALAAQRRHAAVAACVSAALAQEQGVLLQRVQQAADGPAAARHQQQRAREADAMAALLARCMAEGALSASERDLYCFAFRRLLNASERRLDLEGCEAFAAAEGDWRPVAVGVRNALAQALPR